MVRGSLRQLVLVVLVMACGGGDDGSPAAPAATPAPTSPAQARAAPMSPELDAMVAHAISRLDDETFEVDGALLDRLWAEPTQFTGGARLTAGPVDGLQLHDAGPGTIYAHLGLASGDLLHEVNGTPLSLTRDDERFRGLRANGTLVLTLTRAGARRMLTYRIRATRPTTPVPPSHTGGGPDDLADAMRAFDRGDYAAAITSARDALLRQPGNTRLLRVLVSSYCITGDAANARTYYAQLPDIDRTHMDRRCSRYGIDFR